MHRVVYIFNVQFYPVILKVVPVSAQTPKLLGIGVSSHYVSQFADDLLIQLLGGFLAMGQGGIVIVEV